MTAFWKNTPPQSTEFAGIRLQRLPPKTTWTAIITCSTLVGADTHYANRRTQPCSGPDCPLCRDGIPARWHGYLSLWSPRSHAQTVLELTALASQPVYDYQQRHGSLRGAEITAERKGNHANSPVTCHLNARDLDLRTLPRAVNIEKFLSTLWNLQDGQPEPSASRLLTRMSPDNARQLEQNELVNTLTQPKQNGD